MGREIAYPTDCQTYHRIAHAHNGYGVVHTWVEADYTQIWMGVQHKCGEWWNEAGDKQTFLSFGEWKDPYEDKKPAEGEYQKSIGETFLILKKKCDFLVYTIIRFHIFVIFQFYAHKIFQIETLAGLKLDPEIVF